MSEILIECVKESISEQRKLLLKFSDLASYLYELREKKDKFLNEYEIGLIWINSLPTKVGEFTKNQMRRHLLNNYNTKAAPIWSSSPESDFLNTLRDIDECEKRIKIVREEIECLEEKLNELINDEPNDSNEDGQ